IFIGVAAVLFAGAMVAPLASPTVAGMMIAYGISALGYGVFQSVDSVLMSEVLPDAQTFGKDLGFVNMAITLPLTLPPAVAGAHALGAPRCATLRQGPGHGEHRHHAAADTRPRRGRCHCPRHRVRLALPHRNRVVPARRPRRDPDQVRALMSHSRSDLCHP